MQEGLGRSPPQREEFAGKVTILVDLVAEFFKIPTARVYRTYSESCWILISAVCDRYYSHLLREVVEDPERYLHEARRRGFWSE